VADLGHDVRSDAKTGNRRTRRGDQGAAGTAVRVAAGIVLIAHGLIHLMGPVLLWRWGQPGTLRYADVHPEAGSVAGVAVGVLWLAAAGLFTVAGALLVLDRPRWRPVAVIGVAFSVPALTTSAAAAAAGLVIDALVLTAVVLSARNQRRVPA